MSLFHPVKKNEEPRLIKKRIQPVERTQFNCTIRRDLARTLQMMAKQFNVPNYSLLEHWIEFGAAAALKISDNVLDRQKLEKHLSEVHVLGKKEEDAPGLLALGQTAVDNDLTQKMEDAMESYAMLDHLIFSRTALPREQRLTKISELRNNLLDAMRKVDMEIKELRRVGKGSGITHIENVDVNTMKLDPGQDDGEVGDDAL